MPEDSKNPVTWVDLDFADGVYRFALPYPQIQELEIACGSSGSDPLYGERVVSPKGIGAIIAAVLNGRYDLPEGPQVGNPAEARWSNADIVETIRLALIGGNRGVVHDEILPVPPHVARRLVENYVMSRPIAEAWTIAAAILSVLYYGRDENPTPPVDALEPAGDPAVEA